MVSIRIAHARLVIHFWKVLHEILHPFLHETAIESLFPINIGESERNFDMLHVKTPTPQFPQMLLQHWSLLIHVTNYHFRILPVKANKCFTDAHIHSLTYIPGSRVWKANTCSTGIKQNKTKQNKKATLFIGNRNAADVSVIIVSNAGCRWHMGYNLCDLNGE